MKNDIIERFIAGKATPEECQQVAAWIDESPENMRQYMSLRKLYDISLWRADARTAKSQRRTLHVDLRRVGREVLKVAAVVAICIGVGYRVMQSVVLGLDPTVQEVAVPAGQRAEISLADGTRVWLNARSKLSFPANFEGDTRNVHLEGEGYFVVATNPDKPFVVETRRMNVVATGTEFDVTAYNGDDLWRTSLIKGKVTICKPGETEGTTLAPGTRAELVGNRLLTEAVDDPERFRWREGLICFTNQSMREIFHAMEVIYGVKMDVRRTDILDNRFTGKFRAEDGLEQMLRVMRIRYPFDYTRDDENNRIIIN